MSAVDVFDALGFALATEAQKRCGAIGIVGTLSRLWGRVTVASQKAERRDQCRECESDALCVHEGLRSRKRGGKSTGRLRYGDVRDQV